VAGAERDAGGADLALGAYQALGHGRLGHQERARALVGAKPAQRPQHQRHLSLRRQRRVAAREDELEPLVGEDGVVRHVLVDLRDLEQP
jgi:hypothetical protein